MGRSPCCSDHSLLHRGAWTAEEDLILRQYVTTHGEVQWRSLPAKSGLKRCGKSCRLRWLNYLRPEIKRGNISPDEEDLIIRMHKLLGNRWSLIAGRLPGRTDNEIKNHWNTHLSKKIVSGKETFPKPNTESKPALRAGDRVFKFSPVKATAVRVSKSRDKYLYSNNQDFIPTKAEQTVTSSKSWSELMVEELMTEDDSHLIDIPELGFPSIGINDQYSHESQFPHSQHCAENEGNRSECLLYLNGHFSEEYDLLFSPLHSTEDFRFPELDHTL